jgi:hypothetical protein
MISRLPPVYTLTSKNTFSEGELACVLSGDHFTIKACGGVKVWLHVFLTLALHEINCRTSRSIRCVSEDELPVLI